jgi:hypothetical protein
VLAAGRAAHGVRIPVRRREIELRGDEFQHTSVGSLADAQRSAGMAQIHHLHGNAQAVGQTAMLTNEGEVRFRERGESNQLAFISGECEELGSFCGGQQLAAGHRSKTFVRAWKKRL